MAIMDSEVPAGKRFIVRQGRPHWEVYDRAAGKVINTSKWTDPGQAQALADQLNITHANYPTDYPG